MGMSITLGWAAMGCPARMTDARVTVQRLSNEAAFQIAQLSFGAPAPQLAVFDSRNAGAVIAAVLQAAQRIDKIECDGLVPDYSNDATHALKLIFVFARASHEISRRVLWFALSVCSLPPFVCASR